MLTFVTSEKTGDVIMSFAEGSFTLGQVGHVHKDHSVFSLFTFSLLFTAPHINLITAPASTRDSKECEQECDIILQRSYQEETLKGMTSLLPL